jgi:triphosphoribosyl-dephospho-CoA synthase
MATNLMGQGRHPRPLAANFRSEVVSLSMTKLRFSPASIGAAAVEALLAEARLAPKPGLVDPRHSGAHEDMDYPLLVASAHSLEDCFVRCAAEGRAAAMEDGDWPEGSSRKNVAASRLLPRLRPIGLEGERAMYRATGGVNCHKGAIFCLGLLAAALGWLATQPGARGRPAAEPLGDRACLLVSEICRGLVETELGRREAPIMGRQSAGERLYANLGVRGARGEAEAGFPVLRNWILPILRSPRDREPASVEASRLDALLASMSRLEDSCVLSRGGAEGLVLVREGALAAIAARAESEEGGRRALEGFDAALCARRLSPGGSADLLSAGIFLLAFEA